jgi:glutamate/tyrosine decarboxylase-like PLP-dependent enzyme
MSGAMGEQGHSREQVVEATKQLKAQNAPTYGPRMMRPSYFAGEDVVEVAEQAFSEFIKENWLYARTSYPAIGQFEDDVLSSLFELLHVPQDGGGILTSGGTESIILAVKIARDHARTTGHRSEPYNIVLPRTSHPAFEKAADLLGLEVRREPPSGDYMVDLNWMEQACDECTVLIVGSAPPYPFGQVDPIEMLSKVAQRRELRLHVDACLGGMVLPFLADAGRIAPDFDFRVPGVSSLSVDLHKYGYASKGISGLLLRNRVDESHAMTVFSDSPAGRYATTGISGTRSGGAVASAWAVMRYLGHEGFVARTAKIMDVRDAFIAGLKAIGGRTLGTPDCLHFSFEVDDIDNLALAEVLTREGWLVSSTQGPDSTQLMITAAHEGVEAQFCSTVERLANDIRAGRRRGTGRGAVYSDVVIKR